MHTHKKKERINNACVCVCFVSLHLMHCVDALERSQRSCGFYMALILSALAWVCSFLYIFFGGEVVTPSPATHAAIYKLQSDRERHIISWEKNAEFPFRSFAAACLKFKPACCSFYKVLCKLLTVGNKCEGGELPSSLALCADRRLLIRRRWCGGEEFALPESLDWF